MSRRVSTLLVSGLLFVGLFVLAVTMPIPYVELSPGPTFNTLGYDDNGNVIIVIKGVQPKTTSGHLNMTTVDVSTRDLTPFAAFSGWLAHDRVIVPRASVYPPGQSQNQVDQQNKQDFSQSQDNAIAAASCELGYPQKFGVITVEANAPALNVLEPRDVLDSVAGQPAATSDQLLAVLTKQTPGTTVPIAIERSGKSMTVSVKLGSRPKGAAGGYLGVDVGPICATPFTVDLGLGNEIGGPSAGLMFALGIMDEVGTKDLTGGRFIAGTGTIDASGNVGPIGGIQLKMIAAKRKGASVFLAPAGNCSDVTAATPKGLQVIRVSTLHDAVQDLLALQSGGAVPRC